MKKALHGHGGFTLIELLVVVLIIGLLSAMALMQYQKVVAKSQATQAITLLKSLGEAAEIYIMQNGTMPPSLDDMDVLPPEEWAGTTEWYVKNPHLDTRSNGKFSVQLHGSGLYLGLIDGPYKGAGFAYYTLDNFYHAPQREILCMERKTLGVIFEKSKGEYCRDIMDGTYYGDHSSVDTYTLK